MMNNLENLIDRYGVEGCFAAAMAAVPPMTAAAYTLSGIAVEVLFKESCAAHRNSSFCDPSTRGVAFATLAGAQAALVAICVTVHVVGLPKIWSWLNLAPAPIAPEEVPQPVRPCVGDSSRRDRKQR